LVRLQIGFERGFESLRERYHKLLAILLHHRCLFLTGFLSMALISLAILVPWLGQDFFPVVDTGQFLLHVRAPTGTRIEETARLCDLVERYIRQQTPQDVSTTIDNIGIPYSGINLSYSNSGIIGPADADILVTLTPKHNPTANCVRKLRLHLPDQFPGVTFSFLPSDIVSQTLNFGLPAPMDIQVLGSDQDGNRRFADSLLQKLRNVVGIADLRIQQPFDQPRLNVRVDRTKAQEIGFTQRDVAQALLVGLSGSFQTSPTFWLNPKNHVSYQISTMTPQYWADSLQDLQNIPVTAAPAPSAILANLASLDRGTAMAVVSHYNIAPVIDLYAAAEGRDLGGVSRDIDKIIDASKKNLPRGSEIAVRGQVQTMRSRTSVLSQGWPSRSSWSIC
jgi:multidrug efflux pump subunit AcrB